MRMRTTAVVGAAAVVTTLGPAGAVTAPAHASAGPAKAGDFNGDGRRDLVTASPGGTVAGRQEAGFVTVVYGGKTGPDKTHRQVITQDSPGIPGTPDDYNAFGGAVASADFDRDGYADLAVTAAGRPWRIVIVYGGAKGLTSRTTALTGPGAWNNPYLAVGDFDHDGGTDLASSVSGDTNALVLFRDVRDRAVPATAYPVQTKGDEVDAIDPIAGDFTGDGYTDLVVLVRSSIDGEPVEKRAELRRGSPSGLGAPTPVGSDIGRAAAAGDVNGDGRADLIAATGGGDGDRSDPPEGILVFLGTTSGLGTPKEFTQDTPGVPGVSEAWDGWGTVLAVGDVDGDHRADVAIGAPGEDVGRVQDAGAVTILRGAAGGLTVKGAQIFDQNTAHVPGVAETADAFGGGLSLADLTGDGRADLTTGAPVENREEGGLWVLRGAKTGVTTTGLRTLSPSDLGVAKRHAQLGRVLLP
ncbi:FG-GAP and VCBS repeat-containing protein [Actinoallomurus rhizosphaericola]|uniref:FG-GAP and VCBS repeat-containing protein n=1 Tax=Actinoallomurus rhizosphaericola TaxID=2952536 RepID=UPI00209269E7|nr:FG-GAP and VCBS repeat-containing protein [Actinoallomurus rhizosphaericola]MCO5999715.1 VCBS repeat-containing protein [Actinoallomurus rhizosphaericola]